MPSLPQAEADTLAAIGRELLEIIMALVVEVFFYSKQYAHNS